MRTRHTLIAGQLKHERRRLRGSRMKASIAASPASACTQQQALSSCHRVHPTREQVQELQTGYMEEQVAN